MATRFGTRVKQGIADAVSGSSVLARVFNLTDPPAPGTQQLLDMYGKSPWLRGVVNKVSRNVASVQWSIFVVRPEPGERAMRYRKAQRGTYEQRKVARKQASSSMVLEEIHDHPLLDVLDDPNPHMTGHTARQVTQIWIDLKGEGYWLKERGDFGEVTQLWPIPPHWVKRTPSPSRPWFEIAKGTFQGDVPMSEVLSFQDVNAENPYNRGTGTAQALADELETDEYAAKHTKAWFYNRARPDILVAGPNLSESEARRLEEDWNQKHKGFWRAFKARFTNADLKVHEISQTFESMQLVDLRKHERDTIVQVYGVPPEILGILTNSNRATIEAASFLYAEHVLVPRLELLRDIMQEHLVSDFDERLIIDYESPVPADKEHNLQVANSQPHTLRVNEWREMAGHEPLPEGEGGDVFMLPLNLFPANRFAAPSGQPTQPPPEPEEPSEEPPEEPPEPDEPPEAQEPESADVGASRSAGAGTSKQLTESDVQALVDEAVDPAIVEEATVSLITEVLEERGNAALDFLGFEPNFDLQNPRVTQFIQSYGTNRIRGLVNETTRQNLKNTLVAGVQGGESIAQLSDRVSGVFAEAKGPRAKTIARTEVLRATNWGQNEAWTQTGVIEQREWISTMDGRTRGSDPDDYWDHLDVDGQIRGMEAPFLVSGQQMQYPGDDSLGASAGNTINCRCTMAAVIDDESLLETAEAREMYWKQFDATLERDIRTFDAAVKRAFQQQQDRLNERLRSSE